MNGRQLVLQTLQKRMEQSVNHSVEHLLTNNEINRHVAKLPALKHVLRFGIASGKIPEQNGHKTALNLIQRALHGGQVANQLDKRKIRGGGKPPRLAAEVQEALMDTFQQHDQHASLANDKTFAIYLRKMALNLYELGHTAQELKENQLLAHAILDHIITEYQLMHELRVPPQVIRTFGHQFTVFHADQIYRDATRVFGQDEDSKPLARTAAFQLFTKVYTSIEQAKRAYDAHFRDATRVFGGDEDSKRLARTAAVQLFTKKYQSIEHAKRAYDQRLLEVRESARKVQLRGLKVPELTGLSRDKALEALTPAINRIAGNFKSSLLGGEDAKQIAQLAALEILQTGERNPIKIIDAIIQNVTKEAAIYAFSRVTAPLPEEK